jgi:hypothetical protein
LPERGAIADRIGAQAGKKLGIVESIGQGVI